MDSKTHFFKVNGVSVACIQNSSEITFIGINFLGGSNYETPELAGIAHFAEHMFFKGTKQRNWHQINQEFAKMGANYNAYSSNTEVFYFGACPKDNAQTLINLMADMLFNSTFPEDELEKERKVILEERMMYMDDPSTFFGEAIGDNIFVWEKGHSTLGTPETISKINRQDIVNYLNDKYSLNNMAIICCGNISPDEFRNYLEKVIPFKHQYLNNKPRHLVSDKVWSDKINSADRVKLLIERDNLTQSQVKMMINGISNFNPTCSTSYILLNALGGGGYSMLYERIREELGLCYAVGFTSIPLSYPDYPITTLYGYTSPQNVEQFMDESEKIIQKAIKDGLSDDLFECAKTDCISSTLMVTETSVGRANYLSNRYLFGREDQLEDVVASLQKVTKQDCNDLIGDHFGVPFNWAIMNPTKE